ncbi:putative MFS family arabinose efflux permease [Luteibacter rhizovicinus]|uniref:Putative MFS family arabinose efflux permease n=1 Tax=Luteibacter rhizovicinus TaxID=242606 RepID=A0A4R3YI65_9GAMM|nr:MFS transporter [Luteibacter rhizovicinus]TCV92037.1 putative MFS family arabinose efflux permease [Luteibacter rhizovicinus]
MSSTPRGDASLFAHHAFVRFWFAKNASSFGFQMMSVAVGWQIYELTHRALDLGLIGLAQFVPSVLLALPAGHVADQFDRRRIVVCCQIVEWIAIALLAIASAMGWLSETGILSLIFVVGVAKAFEFPAMQAMLPALVPTPLLPRAMAANASAGQAAMIMGPALGGLLYVAGPTAVCGVSALLYLAALILMSHLNYDHIPPRREPATLKTLFAGVHFIRRRPAVFGVISLDLFAVLLGGATALLPIFAKDILHTGPWGLGLLRASPAVGALLMSILLAHNSLTRRVGPIMFASVAGFGAATLVFALSTSLWLSMASLFALGAFDMVSMVIRGALVQLETPDDMRGRVSAVNAIFINTSNQLGEFESGILAAALGAVNATLIGGIGTLVVVGLWMWWFPSLRRRQGLVSDPEPTEGASGTV